MKNEEGSIFLQRVITGDESWIYEHDPETRRQSEEWKHGGSPCSKKARKSHSKIRSCPSVVFFFLRGLVQHEFVPHGRTVNAAFNVEVLKLLHECVRRVRRELWTEKNWILHHDSAPLHLVLIVREFFSKNDDYHGSPFLFTQFSPLRRFFLFPKVETIVRGEHFGDVENIKCGTARLLKNLTSQDMQHYFLQWKKHWAKCIHLGESTLRVTMCPFQNN
jgi:hypothetical protein